MGEEMYIQLRIKYATPYDQKFSSETKRVGPEWIACLYCSRPAKVGDVIDNSGLKWKIDKDDEYKGCLESLHVKEETGVLTRDCFLSWDGYKSILHDGQLALTFVKDVSWVEGTDVDNTRFRFYKNVLVEGNWPGFIVMQTP